MKTKHKPIDGTYTNYLGETWHALGTENEVLLYREDKRNFKAIKHVKMGCFLHRGIMYFLTDFKK